MLSINRKRSRSTIRVQRQAAAKRSLQKVRVKIIAKLLDDLKADIFELDKLNFPPVNYPLLHTASVVSIGVARGNEGEADPAINRFLANLELDLTLRVGEAARLRRG